jgi:uncharacterized protein YjlB
LKLRAVLCGRRKIAIIEDAKKLLEKATGARRPSPREIKKIRRDPDQRLFEADGKTPNNPKLPWLHYRGVVGLDERFDPAAIFEVLFASHGWSGAWRDGIYDFLHFHTRTHEVLGIALGRAKVQFGGKNGPVIDIEAGDVIVLPAGTGHERKSASSDLLVVGAYPEAGGEYDEPKPGEVPDPVARSRIANVPIPKQDPVFGARGPLRTLWRTKT